MRKGCAVHGENIAQIKRLGINIVALTARNDIEDTSRFYTIEHIGGDVTSNEIDHSIEIAKKHGVSCAVTFQETDIILCAHINEALGVPGASVWAAKICRDKSMQRKLLSSAAIPSVKYRPVKDIEGALAAAREIGFPVIIKPTRAASSINVSLAQNEDSLKNEVESIENFMGTSKGLYFSKESDNSSSMIIEEYLPGTEVTLDGVVIDGTFFLGGIHNKKDMGGPYFEEDLYSLPFKEPERENELSSIAAAICDALDVKNSMFNVELRRDANGNFRVVEFSCRLSGGRVYRNIFDVYGVDMVSAHLASLMPQLSFTPAGFMRRHTPTRATCMKLMYCDGRIICNSPGIAKTKSGFIDYYPLAPIGAQVHSAPNGFDIAAILSVGIECEGVPDAAIAEKLALDLSKEIHLITE